MLLLHARVDLGVMAIEGYTAFLKAPALLEPNHQIVQCHIQDTHSGGFTPLQRISRCIPLLQPTEPLNRSIWPIDRTLTVTNSPEQSGSGGNKSGVINFYCRIVNSGSYISKRPQIPTDADEVLEMFQEWLRKSTQMHTWIHTQSHTHKNIHKYTNIHIHIHKHTYS